MRKLDVNQFQEFFHVKNKGVLIDFLVGTMELYDDYKNIEVCNIFSEEYRELENEYVKNKNLLKSHECTIVLIPSYHCNMECEYCYEGHVKSKSGIISTDEIEIIINQIKKIIAKHDYQSICFILLGGEPIYEKNLNFFKYFFSVFKDENIPYSIACVSNGLDISEKIDTILEIGISQFQLTIDGLEKVHNMRKRSKIIDKNPFINVCKSVDTLLNLGIDTIVRINIDKDNVDSIPDIAKLIKERGWSKYENFSAYLYPISYSGNFIDKEYDDEVNILCKVINQIERLSIEENVFELDFHGLDFIDNILEGKTFLPKFQFCSSCSSQFVFDGNRNIYTCWWGGNNKAFKIGDFNNLSSNLYKNEVDRWNNHSILSIKSCFNCKYKYICGGGCVFKANMNHGSLDNGNCADFTNIFRIYLEYKLEL